MKKVFLTVLCILSFQSAFAKEVKINEKSGVAVDFEEQFVPQLMNVCDNCSREIRKACQKYTSTDSNEELCNRIGSKPQITKGCYYNSSTYFGEADCLSQQVDPEIAKGCKAYTSTYSNERLCMHLEVSPYDAETCKRYTSTYSAETQCLRECGNRSQRGTSVILGF